jgi:uncharacterized membrane protein YsdA (DUF1294 family)
MINISFSLTYIELYLLLINIISFGYYLYDKLESYKKGKNIKRISEKNLLFTSFIGGSLGSFFAMILFRHKIAKTSFILKFGIIVIMQIVIVFILKGL